LLFRVLRLSTTPLRARREGSCSSRAVGWLLVAPSATSFLRSDVDFLEWLGSEVCSIKLRL
jgi:hypothetical protein